MTLVILNATPRCQLILQSLPAQTLPVRLRRLQALTVSLHVAVITLCLTYETVVFLFLY